MSAWDLRPNILVWSAWFWTSIGHKLNPDVGNQLKKDN